MHASFFRRIAAVAVLLHVGTAYCQTAPEISVLGRYDRKANSGVTIVSGDTTPSTTDGTEYYSPVDVCCGVVGMTFRIVNTGNDVLRLTAPITVSGPAAADFTVTQPPATALSAGAGMDFYVDFNPSAPGVRTATITIASNDADENPYTFVIQGTGRSSNVEIDAFGNDIPIASSDMTPSEADGTDFGGASLAGGSVTHTFTFRMTGTGTPSIGFDEIGPNTGDFVLQSSTTSPTADGSTMTFTVRFAPLPGAAGVRTATFRIHNNDDDENPYVFAVQGTALDGGVLAPEIEVRSENAGAPALVSGDTTPSVAKGTYIENVPVGGGKPLLFVIENTGGAALDVGRLSLSGSSDFVIQRYYSPSRVEARQSARISIWYTPTHVSSTEQATVTIPNSDSDENPFVFTVDGSAVAPPDLPISVTGNGLPVRNGATATSAANGTDFGDWVMFTPGGLTRTFTLTNTGSEPVTLIQWANVYGPESSGFGLSSGPAYGTLAPGASTSFSIRFLPSEPGPQRGIFYVVLDGTPLQSYQFWVTANAIAAGTAPAITSASAASGTVGQPFRYQIEASGSPTSYSAQPLPAGLSINAATGLISGTPAVAGTFSVQLRATNTSGTGEGQLTLTMTPASDGTPPSGTTKSDQTITFSSPVSAVMIGQPIQLGATSSAGLPITYSVVSGDATLSGTTITPTSTATLIVRASSAGNETVNAASVDVSFGNPQKAAQVINVSTNAGSVAAEKPVALAATTTSGLPITYTVVSGPATVSGSTLTFTGTGAVVVRASQAGDGTYAAANDVTLNFTATPVNRLVNLSARAHVAAGDASRGAIAGFVVTGSAPKPILVRAVGPSLAAFGVTAPLPTPQLQVFDSHGAVLASNRGWSNDAQIAAAGDGVGAFKLASGSKDAAILMTLAPGAYTAQVQSDDGGTVLVEVYDVAANAAVPTKQLINLSTRGSVGSGDDVIVGGFVVSGASAKRVLIRAVGPGLAGYGVAGVLADPMLKLYDAKGTVLARNDNWETAQGGDALTFTTTAADVSAANSAAGAFTLASGSKDAALVLTLEPGAYTAVVSGAGNASGAALVEVYELPEK